MMFLIFLTLNLVFANNLDIANALKHNAIKYDIDKKILYTIAKIESNFETNIIAFLSDKKWKIKGESIKIKNIKYKNKFLVQIRASINELKQIATYLIQKGYKIDVGLMQINSINFNLDELNVIFNPNYNIQKAVIVLKQCRNNFKNTKNTIECYNKGNRIGEKYDYYQRFLKHYIKDFG
ncbi:transglycosylase SLT domain-containing protein [Campylobacter coli]|nr:transglycosylase SLT domain-containing protein [Campylobacter coli]